LFWNIPSVPGAPATSDAQPEVLVSVAALGDEVADSLLRCRCLCAHFCELIGAKVTMCRETHELFLLGLLSVMDALLNMRMSDVLAEIPVNDDMRKAVLGQASRYRPIFEVLLDYQSGTWKQLAHCARHVGLMNSFCWTFICARCVG
jgi:c-di-GMP-related signal transduction protein